MKKNAQLAKERDMACNQINTTISKERELENEIILRGLLTLNTQVLRVILVTRVTYEI